MHENGQGFRGKPAQRFSYPALTALGCGHCKCNYQTASQTATCRRRVLRYCNQHVASSSPGILIMAFNCPITSGMCDWRDWHVINESRGYRARSISAIGLGRIRLQAILRGTTKMMTQLYGFHNNNNILEVRCSDVVHAKI